MRLDFQSAIVMIAAVACSTGVAVWLKDVNNQGMAQAAPMPIVATATATADSTPTQVLKSADGHYWAEADIDGRAVRVLVDTGASVVALTREDALRLGLDLKPSDFTRDIQTASGVAQAASIELAHVSVAGARVEKVQALVVEKGLSHSLLGMSYLGRLSSMEATPAGLTLRP